jgi:glyoxylase-like metal-dependent hydrolase (beta-lactamase superfamily II)
MLDCSLIDHLAVHRFVYKYLDANMYILLEGDEAIVIDPHANEALIPFLNENKVQKVTILLTHEHYDHVCGIPVLKEAFKTTLVCSQNCAEMISVEKHNRPLLIGCILAEKDRENGTALEQEFNATHKPFTCKADLTFEEELNYTCKGRKIHFKRIPGHSPGSACITIDDTILFTGDSLMLNLEAITRFPGGSTKEYQNITLPHLKSLNRGLYVFPGHEESFYLRDKFEA